MSWQEFCSLVSGLSGDTPLGRIVQIRSEQNNDILKTFTSQQRKIRADWLKKKADKVTPAEKDYFLRAFAAGIKGG
jgi:hypothetical protein